MISFSISDIESVINLWNRFIGRAKKQPETVAGRFIRLFEAHGVHRNQIPRFFGHGITIADVNDEKKLLPKLTEEILDAAVELFAARREWLDGADERIYPLHDFYKHPEEFETFLNEIQAAKPESRISGFLFAPESKDYGAEALIVLEVPIGGVGEKEINRFHLCHNWFFSYWKARAYLTACVAIAWRRGIHLYGRVVDEKSIKKFSDGCNFLELDSDGSHSLRGKHWYPEDMALEPNVFLNGIDPEQDNFGIKAGLELWLKLEEKGYLKTNIPNQGSPRAEFEKALAKHKLR